MLLLSEISSLHKPTKNLPPNFPMFSIIIFAGFGTSMWSKAGTGKRHLGVHGDDLRRSENLIRKKKHTHDAWSKLMMMMMMRIIMMIIIIISSLVFHARKFFPGEKELSTDLICCVCMCLFVKYPRTPQRKGAISRTQSVGSTNEYKYLVQWTAPTQKKRDSVTPGQNRLWSFLWKRRQKYNDFRFYILSWTALVRWWF